MNQLSTAIYHTSHKAIDIILCFALIVYPTILNAEIYKWVDEKGKVHFGDRPPADNDKVNTVEIDTKPNSQASPIMDAERIKKQKLLLEIYDEERAQRKQDYLANKEKKEQNKIECARLEKKLKEMKNAQILYKETDDPKNPIISTVQEKQQTEQALQKRINSVCGK